MRISHRIRLLVLAAAVVVGFSPPAAGQEGCKWTQWQDYGTYTWYGYWDCEHCDAMYVYPLGGDGWEEAGDDCDEELPTYN